jgi:hypothetical protein
VQAIEIRSEAVRLAPSDLGDEELKSMLADRIRGDRHELELAVRELSELTPNYAYDRAARILRAVLEDTPVAPLSGAHAELFEWEREIAHLPPGDAYAELCALEPRLHDLLARTPEWRRKAEHSRLSTIHRIRAVNRISRAVDRVLGPESGAEDPRLRSAVASGVAFNHLIGLVGVGVAD